MSKKVNLRKEQNEKIDIELLRLKKHMPNKSIIYHSVFQDENGYKATVSMHCLGRYIKAEGSSIHDPAIAFDEAVDNAIRQIRKLKTARYEKTGIDVQGLNQEIPETNDISMENFKDFDAMQCNRITKTHDIDIKPMTADAAIDEMEQNNGNFYVFYDVNGNVNVVYKRKNGRGYGLLCG